MIPGGNLIAVCQIQIRAVPLKDVPATVVLTKNNLRPEESNIDPRKVVSFTFQNIDIFVVIENPVSDPALFIGNELSRYTIHGERNQEINEVSRNKIGDTRADALGVGGELIKPEI